MLFLCYLVEVIELRYFHPHLSLPLSLYCSHSPSFSLPVCLSQSLIPQSLSSQCAESPSVKLTVSHSLSTGSFSTPRNIIEQWTTKALADNNDLLITAKHFSVSLPLQSLHLICLVRSIHLPWASSNHRIGLPLSPTSSHLPLSLPLSILLFKSSDWSYPSHIRPLWWLIDVNANQWGASFTPHLNTHTHKQTHTHTQRE